MPYNSLPHYLYHGTNTEEFAVQQQKGFYTKEGPLITSVDFFLYTALVAGIDSCRKNAKNAQKAQKAKPLLIVLPAENYWDNIKINFLSTGKNPSARYEINGKIPFDDIEIVDSLERLLEIRPSLTERERKKFEKYYL